MYNLDLQEEDIQMLLTALHRNSEYFTDQDRLDSLSQYLQDALSDFAVGNEGRLSVEERNR